jgi:hypothetical protein
MLLVQKFLENNTFGALASEHGVYVRFSNSGHKFSLNYDQLEAKESNPLAQECRGLILSLEDGSKILDTNAMDIAARDAIIPGKTKILAYPMKRFFNHGQGAAADINWSDRNLAILEKLDGTLCIVYYDPFTYQWCVATRSVADADLFMDNGVFTFRTLFEKAVQDTMTITFAELTDSLNKEITYYFELTTPYNRIVVHYPNNMITLLGARDLISLEEINPIELEIVQSGKLPYARAYTYTSVNELLTLVSSLNPMEHEGVVVRDSQFNRIKVKNAAYVAYNKMRDCLITSPRNCVEIILLEKDDDVISFLPEEIVKNLIKIKADVQLIIKQYDEIYVTIKAEADTILPGDKKTFALLLTKKEKLWSAPLFQMFDGKVINMKDFINKNRKEDTWSNSFLDKLLELSNHL